MPSPTTQSRQALRNRFVRHAIPTEKDFADLINASLNLADDGVVKLPDQPLGLVRQKPEQAVLRLFANPDVDSAAWQMQLIGPDKPGLGFTNQAGASALVLEGTSGHVGVGTTSPTARLTVCEANGSPAAANSGSLLIDHEDSGGASSIVLRSKVDRGNDFAYIEYRDKNPALSTSQAGLLTIGIENETDDHLALMPSGNVGIATRTPSAKLHVAGAMRVDAALTVQGALSASGKVVIGQPGDASDLPGAGDLAIRSGQPMLDFIDTDPNQKDWRVFANESKLLFVSSANKTDSETFLTLNNTGTIKWLDLLEAANPIRISSQFTNQASHTHGERNNWAEICNDTNNFKCLMIVGNKSSNAAGNGRRKVGIYDDVAVAGDLQVNRNISALGKAEIGATASETKNEGLSLSTQGQLALKGNHSQLDFIDNDAANANWAIHVNGGNMYFIRAPWVYDTMILNSNGNVGIGTGSKDHKLHVAGDMKVDNKMTSLSMFARECIIGEPPSATPPGPGEDRRHSRLLGGQLDIAAYPYNFSMAIDPRTGNVLFRTTSETSTRQMVWTGTGFITPSDASLKHAIKPENDILSRLLQLQVRSFRWKGSEPSAPRQIGFIAQEVQEIFPDLVQPFQHDDGRDLLSIDYTGFGTLCVASIKELKQQLDGELQSIRSSVDALRQQLESIRGEVSP